MICRFGPGKEIPLLPLSAKPKQMNEKFITNIAIFRCSRATTDCLWIGVVRGEEVKVPFDHINFANMVACHWERLWNLQQGSKEKADNTSNAYSYNILLA